MTIETDANDATIAALQARLEALEADRSRDEQIKTAHEAGLNPVPRLSGHARDVLEAQDRALAVRRAAHEDYCRRCEAQQQAAAPKVAKLRGELGEIEERRQAEMARHRSALRPLEIEVQRVTAKIAGLEAPPPMPDFTDDGSAGRDLAEREHVRRYGPGSLDVELANRREQLAGKGR